MNTILYSKANSIRTKLLLYIDKELQSRKNNNTTLFNKLNKKKEKFHYINFEENYSQQNNEKFCNNFGFQQKKLNNDPNRLNSTCDITPTSVKSKNFSSTIHIKDKTYSIRKTSKHSSTFQIFEKPKIGKDYLKFLCNNLKTTYIHSDSPINIKRLKISHHKNSENDNKEIPASLCKKVKFSKLLNKKKSTEDNINMKNHNPSRIKNQIYKMIKMNNN